MDINSLGHSPNIWVSGLNRKEGSQLWEPRWNRDAQPRPDIWLAQGRWRKDTMGEWISAFNRFPPRMTVSLLSITKEQIWWGVWTESKRGEWKHLEWAQPFIATWMQFPVFFDQEIQRPLPCCVQVLWEPLPVRRKGDSSSSPGYFFSSVINNNAKLQVCVCVWASGPSSSILLLCSRAG